MSQSILNKTIYARTMNGVITLSDGTLTIENGNISNANNINTAYLKTNLLDISSNVIIDGSLNIKGNLIANGNVSLLGLNNTITGNITSSGVLTQTGNITSSGVLTQTGNILASGTTSKCSVEPPRATAINTRNRCASKAPTRHMKNKRRTHSAEFKARVALEAIKGIKTVQEIAADNQVHPTQVTQWKSQIS